MASNKVGLSDLFIKRITSGLQRQAVTTCSKWSERYRVMGRPFPGPFSFQHHPWLRAMHDSKADMNIGRKSAQMGYTETLLNWVFYHIDINQESALYVLPSDDDAGTFSASRFDPAIELSTHLSSMFTDVKNTRHKRAGSANLYIRGSRSKSKLKSIPVGIVAIDEKDEMVQENIPLIFERQSGQNDKQTWQISTPTFQGYGIEQDFSQSTKEQFFFKCPSCSKFIALNYPDNVVIEGESETDTNTSNTRYICNLCSATLVDKDTSQSAKEALLSSGQWVAETSSTDIRGFYINQLYSPTISPKEMAAAFFRGLRDPAAEQEFFNSKLGLPHVVKGAKVDDEDITACIGNYQNETKSKTAVVTMGVDVGKWLHVEITDWRAIDTQGDLNDSSVPRVIFEGKVAEFESLDGLMYKYGVGHCVVDANPERRKAFEFANRFPGMVNCCFYADNTKTRNISHNDTFVTVDRTAWLDLSLGRFKNHSISIPVNTSLEYKSHIKNVVKKYEKDADGNPTGRYINTGDDHFAHARNYNEIALALFSANVNKDIR